MYTVQNKNNNYKTMKINTLLIVLACILVSTFGYSQTEKGSMLLGGNFNIGVSTVDDNSVFNFGLSPNIGFFVIDNLTIGGAIGVNVRSAETFTNSSFSIVPEVRYYFPPLTDKIYAFATAGGGFFTSRTNFDLTSMANATESGFITNLGVGAAFFLTDNVALEAIFRHNFTKIEDNINGIVNLGLVGGVQVYLGRD